MNKNSNQSVNKTFSKPVEDKYSKRFISAVKLINLIFPYLGKVPKGFNECKECKKNGPFQISYRKYRLGGKKILRVTSSTTEGKLFSLLTCSTCGSSGFIDFVSNAKNTLNKDKQFLKSVPLYCLSGNKLDNSASIFYRLYFDDRTSYIKNTFINLKILPKKNINKQATEFIKFFAQYKKERDKRRRFIKLHFDEIYTKIAGKQAAEMEGLSSIHIKKSNFYHFTPVNWEIDDTIKIVFHQKLNGLTLRFPKKIESKGPYLLDVKNPDYSNVKKMLNAIFYSTKIYIQR
jgi:hypothetical protein